MELDFSDMCFGCGKRNDCGLQLDISYDNGRSWAKVRFKEHHQGWKGIVHGGVIAAALDEMMAYAVGSTGRARTVTVKLNITYRKPVKVGEEYNLESEVVESKGRKIYVKALLKDDNKVHAEAEGIYLEVKEVKV